MAGPARLDCLWFLDECANENEVVLRSFYGKYMHYNEVDDAIDVSLSQGYPWNLEKSSTDDPALLPTHSAATSNKTNSNSGKGLQFSSPKLQIVCLSTTLENGEKRWLSHTARGEVQVSYGMDGWKIEKRDGENEISLEDLYARLETTTSSSSFVKKLKTKVFAKGPVI